MLLRAPRPDEAEIVLRLLDARDTADLGRANSTLGDLLDEWRASEFDLAADAAVCQTGTGALAGYAVVRRAGTFAAVHPQREGEGIGSALLDWCERRQRELGWSEHRTAVAASNERGISLLRAHGYRLLRSYSRMVSELESMPTEVAAPAHVVVRTLEPAVDGPALFALDRAAFASVAGTEPESLDAFTEEHLQAHDLDPSLSFVAETDGRAVGFVLTRRWQQELAGYVEILAVAPEEAGRGLGRALLLRAFAAIRDAGLCEAQLGVAGDNSRALRLYERVGMRPRFHLNVYERPAS